VGMNFISASVSMGPTRTGAGCGDKGGVALDMTVLDPSKIAQPPIPRCWMVTGKAVPIGDVFAGIQAGFEIINYNFHTNGSQGAAPSQTDLSGPRG
jgi:hypothetical protein